MYIPRAIAATVFAFAKNFSILLVTGPRRDRASPKVYFLDTGLAAYLTCWMTPETLEAGASSGAFFETFWRMVYVILWSIILKSKNFVGRMHG
jgi:hypothetical protein